MHCMQYGSNSLVILLHLMLNYLILFLQASLSKKFKVSGIPTLVFVNAKTGELIEKNGRSVVTEDPNGENFPWKPETFGDVIPGVFVSKDGNKISWDDCKGKTVGLYFSAHWVRDIDKQILF